MFTANTRQFKFVIFNLEILWVLLFTWKLRFPKNLELLFTVLVIIIHGSLGIESIQLNVQAVLFGDGYRENFYWRKWPQIYFLNIEASAFFYLKKHTQLLKNMLCYFIYFSFSRSLSSHILTVSDKTQETSDGRTDFGLQVCPCSLVYCCIFYIKCPLS